MSILIAERTVELLGDAFVYRPIDLVKVKGKSQHVSIYEPLARKSGQAGELSHAKELSALFTEAMTAYRKGNFSEAAGLFQIVDAFRKKTSSLGGDGASQVFIGRCQEMMARPGVESWDGIYVAKSK